MELRPSEIRYSQDSIHNTFHGGIPLCVILTYLRSNKIKVNDIPRISVMKKDGNWITADNRRLWIFKQLESSGHISTIPVDQIYSIPFEKLTSKNGGLSVRVRGGNYFL